MPGLEVVAAVEEVDGVAEAACAAEVAACRAAAVGLAAVAEDGRPLDARLHLTDHPVAATRVAAGQVGRVVHKWAICRGRVAGPGRVVVSRIGQTLAGPAAVRLQAAVSLVLAGPAAVGLALADPVVDRLPAAEGPVAGRSPAVVDLVAVSLQVAVDPRRDSSRISSTWVAVAVVVSRVLEQAASVAGLRENSFTTIPAAFNPVRVLAPADGRESVISPATFPLRDPVLVERGPCGQAMRVFDQGKARVRAPVAAEFSDRNPERGFDPAVVARGHNVPAVPVKVFVQAKAAKERSDRASTIGPVDPAATIDHSAPAITLAPLGLARVAAVSRGAPVNGRIVLEVVTGRTIGRIASTIGINGTTGGKTIMSTSTTIGVTIGATTIIGSIEIGGITVPTFIGITRIISPIGDGPRGRWSPAGSRAGAGASRCTTATATTCTTRAIRCTTATNPWPAPMSTLSRRKQSPRAFRRTCSRPSRIGCRWAYLR